MPLKSTSQANKLYFIFGSKDKKLSESLSKQKEDEEGTALTAWGLVILIIWEEIIQSLFGRV